MGYFADERIKKGTRATTREDKAPMPKNRLDMNIKPSVTKGDEGSTIPLNQSKPTFTMDSDQKKKSKQFPR